MTFISNTAPCRMTEECLKEKINYANKHLRENSNSRGLGWLSRHRDLLQRELDSRAVTASKVATCILEEA